MSVHGEAPLVSICITSYNYGQYITEAIDSALAQTYPHVEVVVVDNCSTDDTWERIAKYAENPRVILARNTSNIGMVGNHNAAVRMARGECIVLLSADDVVFPHHVSQLVSRMLDVNDPVDVVYAAVAHLDAQAQPVRARCYSGAMQIGYSGRDDLANIVSNFYHAFHAMLIPKRVFEALGYLDEEIVSAFDVDFCARIELAGYRAAYVPEIVAGYREHGKRYSIGSWQQSEGYLRDKVIYLEKCVRAEYAWRLEGCERRLHDVLASELRNCEAVKGAPMEASWRERLLVIMQRLNEFANTPTVWPAERPRVSVIVTTDGYLPLLKKTLDALSQQRWQDFEVIVMHGDGWGIEGWLKSHALGSRLRYYRASMVPTFALARQAALHLSRGQFVTYLAEGQVILPYHLERLLYCIDQAQVDVAFSDRASFADDGFLMPYDEDKRMHCFEEPFVRAERLMNPNTTPLATILHRRSLFWKSAYVENAYFEFSEEELVQHFRRQPHASVSNTAQTPHPRYVPVERYDSASAQHQRDEFFRALQRNFERAKSHLL